MAVEPSFWVGAAAVADSSLLSFLSQFSGLIVFFLGFVTFGFVLQLCLLFEISWLWDPAPIVAGAVAAIASVPFTLPYAQIRGGVAWVAFTALVYFIHIAGWTLWYLVWAEKEERIETPGDLEPIDVRLEPLRETLSTMKDWPDRRPR